MIDLALVPRPSRTAQEPAPRWLLSVALLGSALLHLGVVLLVGVLFRAPELDVEFTLPMDVELGTSEAVEATLPASPPAPLPDEAAPAGGAGARAGEAIDAGLRDDAGLADAAIVADASLADASVADAGAVDAGTRRKPRDAGTAALASLDGGGSLAGDRGDASGAAAGARTGSSLHVPPGAQIAVRVDMARLRESPLAGDVRGLLQAIPDWRALLEGSGIDPLEQLDRLLIATPNLQRDKIVVAGRYVGGEQVVRDAVQRLADARGVAAPWQREGAIPVAPWANADRTERVIALVGPRHFTISRPEDLPRVLALAAARARGAKGRARKEPAEALLAMEEDEGLSLEVDGVAQFVKRGRRVVPESMRLSAREAGRNIALVGTFVYPDGAQASDARAAWDELRGTYARNPLVMLLGLAGVLADAEVAQHEDEVRVEVALTIEQTRLVLGYVRELVRPPAAP